MATNPADFVIDCLSGHVKSAKGHSRAPTIVFSELISHNDEYRFRRPSSSRDGAGGQVSVVCGMRGHVCVSEGQKDVDEHLLHGAVFRLLLIHFGEEASVVLS